MNSSLMFSKKKKKQDVKACMTLTADKCTENRNSSVLKAFRFLVFKPLMLVIKLVKVGLGENIWKGVINITGVLIFISLEIQNICLDSSCTGMETIEIWST